MQKTNGEELSWTIPRTCPIPAVIEEIAEPMVKAFIMVPNEYIGDIMQLVMEKRGDVTTPSRSMTRRVMLQCILPLNEILVDFNDKLKSITRGYGSMDYEHAGYRAATW